MNRLFSSFLLIFSNKSEKIKEDKKAIRRQIRDLKSDLTNEQKQTEAFAVFKKIEQLPEFKNAGTILMYWSTGDELPTQITINKWVTDKAIVLPSIKGQKLVLKKYFPEAPMIQRKLGIWEPDLPKVYEGKIDLVIVPGIAFDRKKNRLGRGKGYYDRFFSHIKPMKIGVGFDFQLMDSIPTNQKDKKMNKIITMSETIE
jgi:5-formyltetrahydrofolate cyclo-ligase